MTDDKINYREHEYDFDDTPHVASSTDCTGLIQTPPHSVSELESYLELSETQFSAQDGEIQPEYTDLQSLTFQNADARQYYNELPENVREKLEPHSNAITTFESLKRYADEAAHRTNGNI